MSTSQPASVIVPGASRQLEVERSEGTWEEMRGGIVTEAVHYVIAAMLIASAVEPIARMPLAWISGAGSWRHGAGDTLKGYGAMAAAAGLTAAGMLAGGSSAPAYYAPTTSLVGIVLAGAALVFAWERATIHPPVTVPADASR